MFENLKIFQTAQAMAVHSAQRQNLIAQNVANADTPGYRSRDLMSFADTYTESGGMGLRATRAGHFSSSEDADIAREALQDDSNISPNGNSVSIEDEMLKSIDVKRKHDLSMTIYKTSLGILRRSIGSS